MSSMLVRDAHDTERRQAFQMALAEPGMDAYQARRVCELTESFLQRCGGQIGGLHVLHAHDRLIAACASLDLPGSVSLLMLPAWNLARTALPHSPTCLPSPPGPPIAATAASPRS